MSAAPIGKRAGDGPFERWVCFGLGGELYGLPILRVQEVLTLTPIEPVPGAAPTLLGVINLRGQVVTVVDLRAHLGFAAPAPGAEARIVVVDDRGETIGLLVDGVSDVRKLAQAAIKPAPHVEAQRRVPVAGIVSRNGELLTLLDLDRLLRFTA